MYIIELFFKLKEKLKTLKMVKISENTTLSLDKDEEKCEHVFLPVDSTNTVLACVKCGYLIHCESDEFKKKNIFEENINNPEFNDNNGEDFTQL